MKSKLDKFQSLLDDMRNSFIEELPERCDKIERLVFNLEKSYEKDIFDDIYRHVHSLKGSGGIHGFLIVTTICHQFENRLSEYHDGLNSQKASCIYAYIDLLRNVADLEQRGVKDFSSIEQKLSEIQATLRQHRYAILIAESSKMIKELYKTLFSAFPVQCTFVDDGISALRHLTQEEFDIFIVAGELSCLNGIAVCLALRASESKNKDVNTILVTSRTQSIPHYAEINHVLPRNANFVKQLTTIISTLTLN